MVDVTPKTLHDLGWSFVQGLLRDRCRSAVGQELASSFGFCADSAAATRDAGLVAELRLLAERREYPPVFSAGTVREPVERACRGAVLEGEELDRVAGFAENLRQVSDFFEQVADLAPLAAGFVSVIPDLGPLGRSIRSMLEPGGRIRDNATPALRELRARCLEMRSRIIERLKGYIHSRELEGALREEYYTVRDDRFVLPVIAGHNDRVEGIVHGHSGSGQTFFIEPSGMVAANNGYKLAQGEVEQEERRILRSLSEETGQRSSELLAAGALAARYDLHLAAARLSEDLDCVPAEFGSEDTLELRDARHPELAIGGQSVVPNDVLVPAGRRVLIVSGPNTGGKSVFLKTAGLLCLMAAAGLHIPARKGSRLPYFEKVRSIIGDEQSIGRHLSTFSANIEHVKALDREAGPGTLVLLDEIIVGTDPEEGSALAAAIVTRLAGAGPLVIATTHYGRLKFLAENSGQFRNASMGTDPGGLRPTYRIRYDLPGRSGAIDTAERLGLDPEVVADARAIVSGAPSELDRLVRDLHARHAEAEAMKDELAARQTALEGERAAVRRREEELEREKERLIREKARGFDERVRALEAELRAMVSELQRGPEIGRANRALERLRGARSEIGQEAQTEAPRGGEGPAGLKPGDEVRIEGVGRAGRVIEVPAGGRKVRVDVGGITLEVERQRIVSARQGGPATAARWSGMVGPLEEPPPLKLDLRGKGVEEALEELAAYLDRALLASLPAVTIVHGHGTGALKRAVRDHLAASGMVASFRPGGPGEGGDGATIAIPGRPASG